MKRVASGELVAVKCSGVSLDDLIDDAVFLIFGSLPTAYDVIQLARVSKRFYRIGRMNNIWAFQTYCAMQDSAKPLGLHLKRAFRWLDEEFQKPDSLAAGFMMSRDAEDPAIYHFVYTPPENPPGDVVLPTETTRVAPVDRGRCQLTVGPEAAKTVQTMATDNLLIERLRKIIYSRLQAISRSAKGLGICCGCRVCLSHRGSPTATEKTGFQLVSPLDAGFIR